MKELLEKEEKVMTNNKFDLPAALLTRVEEIKKSAEEMIGNITAQANTRIDDIVFGFAATLEVAPNSTLRLSEDMKSLVVEPGKDEMVKPKTE